MLAGADIRGFGLDLPSCSSEEGASALFICFSTMLMIAVNVRIFGTMWAVFMVLLCVIILFMGRKGLISRLMRQPILILLPSLFVVSCIWSDEIKISLSLGLQTLLVTITTITIAQCTANRQFLLIIFLATSAVCIGCIIHGGVGASATGPVLIGFLGSKDAMGLFAYTGLMTALAIVFDRKSSRSLRAVASVMALFEGYLATSVHATAAVISVGMGIVLFLTTYLILSRFKTTRYLAYFLICFIAIVVFVSGKELVQLFLDISSNHLGKDATLTGRTVLWGKALELFETSPFIGHGYRAYWVGSSLDAQQMLHMMNVSDGRGFHFHEQYLEVLADTGILGFVVLLLTFMIFMKKIWSNVIAHRTSFSAYSFATIVIYYIRYVGETAFLPFSFDMMILFGLAAAAMRQPMTKNGVYRDISTNKNLSVNQWL